ncbi:MAG TPA: DMT family transporter [Acidimicrobiales bacterium]|nr:DMT family transporter [Acidimicrobiales bacterium]
MAYLLAVGAAFANALTTILQRMGVETAPSETTLRLSLITFAIRRKVWLAGFGVMIGAFLLQFTSLHFGRLSEVQPILTLELPFLVLILGVWFGHKLGWSEWAGAVMAAGGLAAFLTLAQPGGGTAQPHFGDWALVAGLVVGVCVLSIALAQVGPVAWRAAMFGVSAAVMFAFTAAIMKEMNVYIVRGWSGVFTSWPPYALAACGLAGVFLAQNAFHSGPITASQSTLVIVDPLASIGIGIGLFGDQLQTAGARGPGEAVGLLVLVAGVFYLTRSPLVAGVKTDDEAGGHILSSRPHGLSFRRRSARESDAASSGDRPVVDGSSESQGSRAAVRGPK